MIFFPCAFAESTFSLQYKLCRVKKVQLGAKGIPYAVTHDGRTIRYPDPDVDSSDTQVDIETGKVKQFIKFEAGALAMVTGGRNIGTFLCRSRCCCCWSAVGECRVADISAQVVLAPSPSARSTLAATTLCT